MPRFACPACRSVLPESGPGTTVLCPKCHQSITFPGSPVASAPVPDRPRTTRGPSTTAAFLLGSAFVSLSLFGTLGIAWLVMGRPPILQRPVVAVRPEPATSATSATETSATRTVASPPRPVGPTERTTGTSESGKSTESTVRPVATSTQPTGPAIQPPRSDPQEEHALEKLARHRFWNRESINPAWVQRIISEMVRWRGDNLVVVILSDGTFGVGFEPELAAAMDKSPADVLCRDVLVLRLTGELDPKKLPALLQEEFDKGAARLGRQNAIAQFQRNYWFNKNLKLHIFDAATGKEAPTRRQ